MPIMIDVWLARVLLRFRHYWCCSGAMVWYWWYRDIPAEKAGVTQAELDEIGPAAPGLLHHGLPWGQALKSRNLWKIMLMYHTYCWGSYFYLSWLHTYLQKGRGFTDRRNEDLLDAAIPCRRLRESCSGGSVSDVLVRRFGLKIGPFGSARPVCFCQRSACLVQP